MSEWKECKLGEICSLITDGKHGNCKDEENSGYYFISAKDVFNGKLHYENARQITKLDFEETDRRTNLQAGDLLITNSGTIGRTALALDIPETRRTTFQKSVAILKPIDDYLQSRFFYYAILWNYTGLIELAEGTTQQNLLLGELRKFSIKIPPLPEQRAIASVLSSLDDKIDLLHRQNKTLEAMAETLFRQWFVEEADEGWEICRLREVCSLITDGKHGDCQNKTKSGYFFISAKDVKGGNVCYENAREITKSDFEETHRRTNLTAGDILITNSGTIGRMAIIRDIPETRRTTFQKSVAILKPNIEKITSKFLYCLLQLNLRAVVELAGGTTQQNLLLGDLRDFEFKCPNNLAINEFDVNVTPCFEKMFVNDTQIHTLTRLRDTLLPKLMSGEVRVVL